MSDAARSAIFASIRRHLRQGPNSTASQAELAAGLSARRRGPALSRHAAADPVEQFIAMASAAAAQIVRAPDRAAIPALVAAILEAAGLPPRIKAAPALADLLWAQAPALTVDFGRGAAEDRAAVTQALAGAAETGTLIAASSADSPCTLHFLPDLHIVVLAVADIAPAYEDAFDRLRDAGAWPRTVNLITGPSRTGDLEQVIMLGAHGPRQLHILLVG